MKIHFPALTIFFSLLLQACVASAPKGADSYTTGGTTNPTAAANRLQSVNIQWKENPDFQYELTRTVPQVLTAVAVTSAQMNGKMNSATTPAVHSGIPEESKQLAAEYFDAFVKVHRELAASQLKKALNSGGIKTGNEMQVTITPLSGYQSIDGFGSGMTLRTTFESVTQSEPFAVDVTVKSGIMWIGVKNAKKPDQEFVDQYVDTLLKKLREMKLL